MSKINIFSLIYKSPKYADFIYDGIAENTPMLKTDAKFYFVVNFKNVESEKIVKYLKEKNYPFYVYDNEPEQPNYPNNLPQIYKSWNACANFADNDCEIICFINSDMYPAKDWLENLLKRLNAQKAVSSLLVESGKVPSLLAHTVVKNFGRTPNTFKKSEFAQFAEILKEDTEQPSGAYMPIAFYKDDFIRAGGFPEGNINGVPGDQILWHGIMPQMGIHHTTSFDSIVYHFQLGEVDS